VDLIKFYVLLWKGVVAADLRIRVMVFNTTFNNISVISWQGCRFEVCAVFQILIIFSLPSIKRNNE
jgi:hypothetical protein